LAPKSTTRKRDGEAPISFDGSGTETTTDALGTELTKDSGPAARGLPSDERYVGSAELLQIIPISEMTLWRWQRDRRVNFPKPVKLGANGRNFWWLPTVRAWQRRRTEEAA
jgi:predicted DNA-binding transcriptional regulator AlpA